MQLTPEEIDATAGHESGHYVAALGLGIPSFPEVFTEHRNQPGGPIAGTCELGRELTPWQGAMIAWAGVLGQAMLGRNYAWMPPFKPTKRELRDWHAMMTTRLNRLSDSDQRMIAGCTKSWAACKHAFALLSRDAARLRRMAGHIASRTRAEIASRERAPAPETVSTAHRARLLEAHLSGMKPDDADRPRLTDLAATESVSREIIEQALTEGRQRGLITIRDISELRQKRQIAKWFDELLVENK